MQKKIVLKVKINCLKCKTHVLKAVTKLCGIDEVSVDADKGTLTVIGDLDPVLLTNQVRKIGKIVDILSVGPPKPNPDPPKAKPEPKPEPCPDRPLHACCDACQLIAVTSFVPCDRTDMCSIL